METISLMIVDSDANLPESMATSLKGQSSLDVVSAVSRRESAIKQLSLQPLVMLLDADVLKRQTLGRFLRTTHIKSPATKVIVMHRELPPDEELIEEIRLGSRGYILHNERPDRVVKAITAVTSGEIWAERRILEKTIVRHTLIPETFQGDAVDMQSLTSRELDMLSLVLKGATNREIAEMSHISERTVKTHLYRVYRKLNVKSRAKAIALFSH
ncbi:MAG: response regulator transcription factor [Nitrospiraceae bacterium]|nr:response regulator transcription factor [Nitrospiraceae bacterium]